MFYCTELSFALVELWVGLQGPTQSECNPHHFKHINVIDFLKRLVFAKAIYHNENDNK